MSVVTRLPSPDSCQHSATRGRVRPRVAAGHRASDAKRPWQVPAGAGQSEAGMGYVIEVESLRAVRRVRASGPSKAEHGAGSAGAAARSAGRLDKQAGWPHAVAAIGAEGCTFMISGIRETGSRRPTARACVT